MAERQEWITPVGTSGTRLPEYANPPPQEVALAVQFAPLLEFRTPHMGLLWRELRSRFPRVEEHPPLAHTTEQFRPSPIRASIQVEALDAPPVPRLWFISEDGTELLQVQQDRFTHNWRRARSGQSYPRYERIRGTFASELDTFRAFLAGEGLGDIAPDQCEVTYVNHLVAGEGWQRFGQVGQVLTVWANRFNDSFLPEPEDVRVALRFVIPGASGEPLGRLHLRLDPGYHPESRLPLLAVNLTARGRPIGDGVRGALAFLDLGHAWAVRGFASIISAELQALWGRDDGR